MRPVKGDIRCDAKNERVANLQFADHPDNVVLRVGTVKMGLFAAPAYVSRHGLPQGDRFERHTFIGLNETAPRPPNFDWKAEAILGAVMALRTNSVASSFERTVDDTGCVSDRDLHPSWHEAVRAVTHIDLHRSSKVQAIFAMRSQHR